MENTRSKCFLSFKLHTILRIMNAPTGPLCPTWSTSCSSVQHIYGIHSALSRLLVISSHLGYYSIETEQSEHEGVEMQGFRYAQDKS